MAEETSPNAARINDELDCAGCGAILKYKPGTHFLKCEYCGAENEIVDPAETTVEIEENSLEEFLQKGLQLEEKMTINTIHCDSCGGTFSFEPNISSGHCPFCASPVVMEGGTTATVFKPRYILPFNIDQSNAKALFKRWLGRLWFAPNDLKKYALNDGGFAGMYLPFWTYDCHTQTQYTGMRGDNYTDHVPVRVIENGKSVTRMKTVIKTRWSPAAGSVENTFDDILIEASRSAPKDKMRKIENWDLKNLSNFNEKYLSGFQTESYTVNLEDAYEAAKIKIQPHIQWMIRNDIGGDRQQIHQMSTEYSDVKFKQILIPVWLSAYRYKGKLFQFLVNGRTGKVAGDRPYSVLKIISTVVLVAVIIALVVIFTK